jgi:hypothetical protein
MRTGCGASSRTCPFTKLAMNPFISDPPAWLSQPPRNGQNELYDYAHRNESPATLN